jgi:hypothetical protein
MTKHIITDSVSRYTRITKTAARKRFAANKPFQICAVKMRPGMPFAMDMLVDPAYIKTERSLTPTYPTLESLFDATICEFCYYNANSHETGTYPAFYIREERFKPNT